MRSEDGYFVRKCLEEDPTAFGFLVDKYKACVYAFTYSRLHNFHDAEDVTQETFIKAYRNLRTLKRYDRFLAWLYAIASNLCKMHIRTQSRRPDKEHIEDQETEKLESPSMDSYRDDIVNKSLREALDSLPDIYQEVLTLYYFGGMDGKEIAKFLGISHDNVKQRLVRARMQLKEEVITMMSATFQQERLQASFTFRIVEAIKRIKIHPMSTAKCVPWGVSIAAGIIFTVLSLGSRIMVSQDIGTPISFSLPSESKVLNIGEIPVDVMKISNIASISNPTGKGGESKQPDMQNAFMAPQAEGGTWVKKADMPIAVGNNSLAAVNGKIYVIGGRDRAFDLGLKPFSSLYEYDPKTDTFLRKADMISPRSDFATSVVDGKIYAISGWSDGDFTNAVEIYDPVTDKWEKKADIPTKRAESAISQVNGKIYVMGGHNQHSGACLPIVEEYDPKTDIWTRKNDMPTARSFATSCVVNNKIYVFGGVIDLVTNFLSPVGIYDPSTDTWTKGSDMPTPRILLGSCIVNGMIYVMGGSDKNYNTTSALEIYDPANDKWIESENMPIARDNIKSYPVVNGKIYAIGGNDANGTFLSDAWEFTPEGLQSIVSSLGKLPSTWGNIKNR